MKPQSGRHRRLGRGDRPVRGDHLADQEHDGPFSPPRDGAAGEGVQRPREPACPPCAAVLHEHSRGRRVEPGREQAAHDLAEGRPSRVDRDRLPGPGEGVEVEVDAPVAGVPGSEGERAGRGAVGQRNARIGCTGEGRRHAGHDFAGDARLAAGRRLLAAAAEHERIAAFQSHHAPALAREADDERIDLVLRHAGGARRLADVDPHRIAGRHRKHLLKNQPVVQDRLRLAEEPRGAQDQEVRARTRADQEHRSRLRAIGDGAPPRDGRLGLPRPPGGQEFGRGAAENGLEESAASTRSGEGTAHPRGEATREFGEPAEPGRQERPDLAADPAGEHGRRAGRGDRHRDRVAIDDRGNDEGAVLRPVDDVHRHAARPRRGGQGAQVLFRRPGAERDRHPVEESGVETDGPADDGTRCGEQGCLAVRRLALADEEDGTAPQIEKGRDVAHQAATGTSRAATSGRQEPQPVPAPVSRPTPSTSWPPQARIVSARTPWQTQITGEGADGRGADRPKARRDPRPRSYPK